MLFLCHSFFYLVLTVISWYDAYNILHSTARLFPNPVDTFLNLHKSYSYYNMHNFPCLFNLCTLNFAILLPCIVYSIQFNF